MKVVNFGGLTGEAFKQFKSVAVRERSMKPRLISEA
jgi:hypothetical protein